MEPRQLGMEESCAATAAEVLKPVETPSDGEGCPICLGQEKAAATWWKETAYGHSFHGRCLLVPPIATQRYVRLPNPMMTMAIEIMNRDPEIYTSEAYEYFRQYT
ncbi:hypothetical protein VPH35_050726 [Triticum aestivum]